MKKLHIFHIFWAITFLLVTGLTASAQVKPGTISGLIKAPQEKAAAGATISLLKTHDSSVVKTVMAGNDGTYDFRDIAAGKYFISVTAAGHTRVYSPVFEVTEASPAVVIISTWSIWLAFIFRR